MADAAASDSESSDIVVKESDFESDLDDEMTADPLNRAQALGADEDGVAGTDGSPICSPIPTTLATNWKVFTLTG